ncbi:MAG: hypothetical protein U0R50_13150 [Gaiellales bacterium]
MTRDRLLRARREARDEAAPFVAIGVLMMAALAVVSAVENWELFARRDWWIWIVLTVPLACLAVVLVSGIGVSATEGDRGRTLVVTLIASVVVGSLAALAAVVTSLVTSALPGGQLLVTAAAILVVNVIAFGLALWELDCGGPVARSERPRQAPDLQFPQDENPSLARSGWVPQLLDYLYVSLTNSVAFSPTDAMPLSRPAKALMAIQGAASAVTVLVVTARAINTIG